MDLEMHPMEDSMYVDMEDAEHEISERARFRKVRAAEAARARYHSLSDEEKRELNLRRTQAQKQKRQREKEMEQLEAILRETNDIQEDPHVAGQLREKRMRAKWAEAARQRYARMSTEERREHNARRRMRQLNNAMNAIKVPESLASVNPSGSNSSGVDGGTADTTGFQAAGIATGEPLHDHQAARDHIKLQNAKKAEAARARYHRMGEEERRLYNRRRTEAFKRRRVAEEMLLALPISRIDSEAMSRAQQIVVRNAKRAEGARLRYQRMTPEQRQALKQRRAAAQVEWQSTADDHHDLEEEDAYNRKRYVPKRAVPETVASAQMNVGSSGSITPSSVPPRVRGGKDAFSSLERDVLKRAEQANQLLRQRAHQDMPPEASSYMISENGQLQQMPQHQSQNQQPQHHGHQQSHHMSPSLPSQRVHQQQVLHGGRPMQPQQQQAPISLQAALDHMWDAEPVQDDYQSRIEKLKEMGVREEDAINTLTLHNWDLNRATAEIFPYW